MIYFTSDLHLGHENVLRFHHRPFADVQEMNRVLITNYNAVVRPEDTVYILGDLAYKISVQDANALIAKLNGKKYLIRGNHDKNYDVSLFEEICDYKDVAACARHFALMHYPIMSWKQMHRGSIHLHGHIHSEGTDYNQENKNNGIRRYDVGVDANNYYPVSIEKILEFMSL